MPRARADVVAGPASLDATRPWLRVPHARGPIVLDGDCDDPGWTAASGPARTGPFRFASGARASPYADARMLWGDGQLYVLLYAADDDIRSRGEDFRLTFAHEGSAYRLEVSPAGAVRGTVRHGQDAREERWPSGAHVSREVDGTIDDPRDRDEEWSAELALPLASLGMKGKPGESAGFSVEHCGTAGACSGWGSPEMGRLVIE
jgi:hypothetical protein